MLEVLELEEMITGLVGNTLDLVERPSSSFLARTIPEKESDRGIAIAFEHHFTFLRIVGSVRIETKRFNSHEFRLYSFQKLWQFLEGNSGEQGQIEGNRHNGFNHLSFLPFCRKITAMTFKEQVYAVVKKIPKGKVMTYGEVAKRIGKPKAARAVGTVLSKNYDPAIPCHRVIRSDGKIGNYNRGGMKSKLVILKREGYRFRD